MEKEQLEMSFEGTVVYRPVIRRQRKLTRARWWFGQMRNVVDCAFDWKAAPPMRPEQTYLSMTRGR